MLNVPNSPKTADLSGQTVTQQVIDGLSEAQLRGAKFKNATLEALDLAGKDLRGCDFTDAVLTRVKFSGADISLANFSNAKFTKCDFSHDRNNEDVDPTLALKAEFECATLNNCNLDGAEFDEAVFRAAVFIDTHFNKVGSLRGADFCGAKLGGINFSGLNRGQLSQTCFSSATLNRANFEESDLTGVKFDEAYMVQANLNGAKMTNTDLYYADLTGAEAVSAVLCGVDFSDVNGWFKNLSQADLSGALFGSFIYQKCNFTGAKFGGTRFGCESGRPTFKECNFKDANFDRAEFNFEPEYLRERLDAKVFEGCELKRIQIGDYISVDDSDCDPDKDKKRYSRRRVREFLEGHCDEHTTLSFAKQEPMRPETVKEILEAATSSEIDPIDLTSGEETAIATVVREYSGGFEVTISIPRPARTDKNTVNRRWRVDANGENVDENRNLPYTILGLIGDEMKYLD